MFIVPKFKQTAPPITVNDLTFARMTSTGQDGDVDVEFNFNVSQLYAVKNNALTVNVTIKRQSLLPNATIKIDNIATAGKDVIKMVMSQGQTIKNLASSNVQSVIDVRRSDVLSKLNKLSLTRLSRMSRENSRDAMNEILLSPDMTSFVRTFVNVSETNKQSQVIPVLQRYLVNNDEQDQVTSQQLSQKTFISHANVSNGATLKGLKKIDGSREELRYRSLLESVSPTTFEANNTRVLSAADAVSGYMRHMSPRSQHMSELVDNLTLPATFIERSSESLSTTDYVMSTTVKFTDYVPFNATLTIPNPWDKSSLVNGSMSSYYVTFELIDSSSGNVVESLTKTLDVAKIVNEFNVPKHKPTVNAGVVCGVRSHIDVRVNDDVSSDVRIYRKSLSRVAPFDVERSFESLGTSYKLINKTVRVTNQHPGSNVHIYRVVPVGQTKVLGTSFTDVVTKSDGRFYNKFVSVTAFPSRSGVTIELRGFSFDVVALQTLRRDVTLNEKQFTSIDDVTLVTQQVRAQGVVFSYDSSVKDGHVYEYTARLTLKGGINQTFGSSIIEYVPFVDGIDTRITDVSITNGTKADVSFNLSTFIAKSSLDDITSMLEAQNLKSYFDEDVLKERDKLQQLIAHNVIRVNLTEGIKEDFGVITDSLFVDSLNQKRNSVSEIDTRNSYRYEVYALLRTPETLFEDFVKQKVDASIGKSFSFKPAKFNHPIALTKGNITSPDTLRMHYGKKTMMFGRVGNIEVLDVAFTRPTVSLSNASAVYDGHTVNVSWSITGTIGIVDHFIVISIVNGVRRLIGAAHPHVSNNECKFIHPVTQADHGYAKYVIIPVLNDYTQLAETSTNTILIQ